MRTQTRIKFLFSFIALVAAFSLIGLKPNTSTVAQSGTAVPTAAGTAAPAAPVSGSEVKLTLAGYAVPREAFADIIPLFQAFWLKKTGQKVTFEESYQGSGAQSRAIVGGFEADVAALSLEKDISRIVDAKLITHDWQKKNKGIITNSVAVLAVRPDNPKKIVDWADLAKPGVEIITPDPATSGGAQWNLLAAYGAVLRGKVDGVDKSQDSALKYIGAVLKNVAVFDKDGRESFLNFERGVGDVAITYENETYAGLTAGGKFEVVYPASTILIEGPAAVIDAYVDKHGTRAVAEAFVDFLWTPEAQQVFADHGFRPVDPEIAKKDEIVKRFPVIKDLFTIDQFGGWSKVGKELFGDTGAISKVLVDVRGK